MVAPAGFEIDWDLPDYPQLPKMFTNAKAAKKRKHKEFIMTDAELDQVVKIPKAANGNPKAQPAAAAAAVDAAQQQQQKQPDNTGTDAASTLSKAERKKQKREAKLAAAEGAATAQPATAATGTAAAATAGEGTKKSKKQKLKELQQQQQPQQQTEKAAIPEQAAGDDAGAAPLPKKSRKNKFKTQEFLQQQQQQVKQNDQQQQQQPAKKQKVEAQKPPQPQKQQQQQQQQQVDAQEQQQQVDAQEQLVQLSKRQLKKLKHTQKQQQQQQQANGNPTAASSAAGAAAKSPSLKASGSGSAGGSKLLQQFKERLQGSRFRQLNEALYTQPGDASFSTMQDQPELFEQYHEGFQQQVKAWPSQPLDAAIKWLKPKPADWVVADFGCGEAQLAATVQQTVHSLDLVAVAPGVIACNMAHTPLESASCDVAVFSLALMGTDYGSFLVEASRVLKPGGWLWVAEVRSRFADDASGKEDFRPLLAALKALGFKLVQQDAGNKMFVVWVLQKKGDVKPAAIDWPTLRACVYKKR